MAPRSVAVVAKARGAHELELVDAGGLAANPRGRVLVIRAGALPLGPILPPHHDPREPPMNTLLNLILIAINLELLRRIRH
ncbi:hypothetical protein GCM10027579_13360 [Calidifontibacter terrae]